MDKELDDLLVSRYPKIFRDRDEDMSKTAMCWGFPGNGWFNIIDQLCNQIEWHVQSTRERRARALRYNRALRRALRGDATALVRLHTYGSSTDAQERGKARVAEILSDPEPQEKIVPEACPPVIAAQVKEKMGTLRFYIDGGDEIVRSMIWLAEGMSSVTCEVCGSPGTIRGDRWLKTLCDEHDKNDSQENSS